MASVGHQQGMLCIMAWLQLVEGFDFLAVEMSVRSR